MNRHRTEMASGPTVTSVRDATRKKGSVLAVVAAVALCLGSYHAHAQTPAGRAGGSPSIVLPDGLVSGQQHVDSPIDIQFVTAPDTAVDLSSLHVWIHKLVGWVEVTQRLLTHPRVRVNGWGIHVEGGVLPAGEHEVRVSFHDLKGRAVDTSATIRILRAGSAI